MNTSGAQLSAFIAAMAAIGYEQTADTGQVVPASANQTSGFVGYLVFRSTDALTATLPIYIRANFSNFTHGVFSVCAAISFAVGFATDGAGNITGQTTSMPFLTGSSNYPAVRSLTNIPSGFFSGNGGDARFCIYPGAYAYIGTDYNRGVHAHSFFAVARIRGADGNPTADGVILVGPDGGVTSTVSRMSVSVLKPSGVFVERSRYLAPFIHTADITHGQVTSVDGAPQLQHPWACTPRLYPFEDVALYGPHGAVAIGDTLNVQVGAVTKKYLAMGRVGICPSTIGHWGSSASYADYVNNSDLFVDVGVAILWE